MRTPPDIIETRIRQMEAEGHSPLEIADEFPDGALINAWLFNEDRAQAKRILDFQCKVSAMRQDAEDMEQALELSAAGWEAQKPDRSPASDSFWGQQRVMSWYWRRPARTKNRPGKLYRSTQQAYNALKRGD